MRIYFCLLIAAFVPLRAQPSRTFLRTVQGVGIGAGVLQLLSELGALRAEQSVARSRARAAAIEERMCQQQVSPAACARYRQLVHEQEQKALKKVRLLGIAADALSAAQEAGHIRNNFFERGLGSAAAVSGIDIAHDDIGARTPLRYLLTLLDGSLSAVRQGWYKNPEQLKWLTAAQATARLLKNMARYGFKSKNKRVWVSYLLQLIRAGAGFVGGPREYEALDGRHLPEPMPGPVPFVRAEYSFAADGWFEDQAPFVEIGGRRYYPHLVRRKLRSDPGPVDIEPVWDQLRAQAENLAGEGKERAIALINRHQRLWSQHGILPDGRPGRGLALNYDHFDDDGRLRNRNGIVVDLAERLSFQRGTVEPRWDQLRKDAQQVLLQTPRNQVLQQIAQAEDAWRDATERTTQVAINNEGQLTDGNGALLPCVWVGGRYYYRALAYRQDKSEPNWSVLKRQTDAISNDDYKAHAHAVIKRHENLWRIKAPLRKYGSAAPDSGGGLYFDDAGNLLNNCGALMSMEALAPPARGRADEPRWKLLLGQAKHILDHNIQARVLRQLIAYQAAWRAYKAGYEKQVFISPEGTIVNALDKEYEAVEIGGRLFYPVLAYEPGKQKPDWAELEADVTPSGHLKVRGLEPARELFRRHYRLWRNKQQLPIDLPLPGESDNYFDDRGNLRNAAGEITARFDGSGYAAFLPKAGQSPPDWAVLRGKAERSLLVSTIKYYLSQCQRMWDCAACSRDLTFGVDGNLRYENMTAEEIAAHRQSVPQDVLYMYNPHAVPYAGVSAGHINGDHQAWGNLAPLSPGPWGVAERPDFKELRERAVSLGLNLDEPVDLSDALFLILDDTPSKRAARIIAHHEQLWNLYEEQERANAARLEQMEQEVARRAAQVQAASHRQERESRVVTRDQKCPVCQDEVYKKDLVSSGGCCDALYCVTCFEQTCLANNNNCAVCTSSFVGQSQQFQPQLEAEAEE